MYANYVSQSPLNKLWLRINFLLNSNKFDCCCCCKQKKNPQKLNGCLTKSINTLAFFIHGIRAEILDHYTTWNGLWTSHEQFWKSNICTIFYILFVIYIYTSNIWIWFILAYDVPSCQISKYIKMGSMSWMWRFLPKGSRFV